MPGFIKVVSLANNADPRRYLHSCSDGPGHGCNFVAASYVRKPAHPV